MTSIFFILFYFQVPFTVVEDMVPHLDMETKISVRFEVDIFHIRDTIRNPKFPEHLFRIEYKVDEYSRIGEITRDENTVQTLERCFQVGEFIELYVRGK